MTARTTFVLALDGFPRALSLSARGSRTGEGKDAHGRQRLISVARHAIVAACATPWTLSTGLTFRGYVSNELSATSSSRLPFVTPLPSYGRRWSSSLRSSRMPVTLRRWIWVG